MRGTEAEEEDVRLKIFKTNGSKKTIFFLLLFYCIFHQHIYPRRSSILYVLYNEISNPIVYSILSYDIIE